MFIFIFGLTLYSIKALIHLFCAPTKMYLLNQVQYWSHWTKYSYFRTNILVVSKSKDQVKGFDKMFSWFRHVCYCASWAFDNLRGNSQETCLEQTLVTARIGLFRKKITIALSSYLCGLSHIMNKINIREQ